MSSVVEAWLGFGSESHTPSESSAPYLAHIGAQQQVVAPAVRRFFPNCMRKAICVWTAQFYSLTV